MPHFNKEYLKKIFIKKFNEIPERYLRSIGYFKSTKLKSGETVNNKKENFQEAYKKVYAALVNNDLEEGKIIKMHPKALFKYFKDAIDSVEIDIIRKETKALRAVVYELGTPLPEFDFIKKNGVCSQYDVEQLEACQKELGYPTVKWNECVVGQIMPMSSTTVDPETGEEIDNSESDEISAATNKFREEEEKRDNLQELYVKLKTKLLSLECKKLFYEWIPREKNEKDFNLKVWAKDKKMNYDTLKGQFFTCVNRFIKIYPGIDELITKAVMRPSG